jgi:hypothetical protein
MTRSQDREKDREIRIVKKSRDILWIFYTKTKVIMANTGFGLYQLLDLPDPYNKEGSRHIHQEMEGLSLMPLL